jgi:hypothetical protein
MGDGRAIYRVSVKTSEGKRPFRRPRRRRKNNSKIDLQAVGWEDKDWIDLPRDGYMWRALVNAVMNLRNS